MTFYILCTFVVLVFWRPQDWLVPVFSGWPILDVIFVVAVLSALIEINRKSIIVRKGIPQHLLLVGVWLGVMMSHIANTYFQGVLDSFPEITKQVIFTILLIIAMDKLQRIKVVMWIFVIMALVMSVHVYMQYNYGSGFIGSQPIFQPASSARPATYRTQFFGIFEDPNDLAQILATTIPFSYCLFKRKKFFTLLLGSLIVSFLVYAIFTTHSRGGMLAEIGAGAVIIALILPSRWLNKIIFLYAMTALVWCLFASKFLDPSAYERIVYWGEANRVFKHNLIFGIGDGMFWQVIQGHAAHNAFVECYTTVGLFGYTFWFGLILLGVLGAYRVRVRLKGIKHPDAKWLRFASGLLIASYAGYCVGAYFLSRTFMYPFFFVFAISAAIPAVAKEYMPDNKPIYNYMRDLVIILPIASVASILYIYVSIILLNKGLYG